jgi:hypothetical protein
MKFNEYIDPQAPFEVLIISLFRYPTSYRTTCRRPRQSQSGSSSTLDTSLPPVSFAPRTTMEANTMVRTLAVRPSLSGSGPGSSAVSSELKHKTAAEVGVAGLLAQHYSGSNSALDPNLPPSTFAPRQDTMGDVAPSITFRQSSSGSGGFADQSPRAALSALHPSVVADDVARLTEFRLKASEFGISANPYASTSAPSRNSTSTAVVKKKKRYRG